MIAPSVLRYLEINGADYHTLRHDPRFTAQEVAQAAHLPGKHLAKSVLLKLIGRGFPRYLLAVLPASELINLERLAWILDEPVILASEYEVEQLFPGIDLGALPPFGELASIPVIADSCLSRTPWIVFHGGTATELIAMTWDEYARLASPRVMHYGREPEPAAPIVGP